MPSQPPKTTIYIDAEDEITAIIDKVRAADGKIIALVLPKRSQTLQSVVNLKLLNRTAKQAKKNLVLITSDPNVLPIAGAVGLHVAKTPQSKPEIPKVPAQQEASSNVETISTDKDAPEAPADAKTDDDTIDLDNDAAAVAVAAVGAAKTKKLFNKKLKVPDFDRFRLWLFGGGGLVVLLIIGSIFAFIVLPKANITIKTDTSSITTDLTLTASTSAKELDKEAKIIPATKKEVKKTGNQKAPATGEKNVGKKASGTIDLKNCSASVNEVTIPAGTSVVTNGLAFFTDEAVELPASSFNGLQQCTTPSESVSVTAQNPGENYNVGEREYSVSGYGSVRAEGSDMAGGTNKVVKVVSQSDIDGAKQKLLEQMNNEAKAELKTQFAGEDMIVLEDTYGASEPVVSSTPNVNSEATEVTVTVSVTYSQLGVKKDDITTLVEENVNKQIDSSKQTIQDNGVDQATIRVTSKKSPDEATFTVSTISIAGPQLDAEGIKQEIAGKKKGETVKIIESRPGIQEVEVDYSPFWVFSTPKRTSHITINFDQGND